MSRRHRKCAQLTLTLVMTLICASSEQDKDSLPQIVQSAISSARPEPPIMPCGTVRELEVDEEVYLESVNYSKRQRYPNSHLCEWNFKFPGKRARLTCPQFQLTEFLCLDHIQVGDGVAVQNHYCGRQGPRDVILVDKLTIRFATSAFLPGIGFHCSLRVLHEEIEEEWDGQFSAADPIPTCRCGINNLGRRVINGTDTEPGEVPWQVGLVRMNEDIPFCGGSLINDRYVLTAAHCIRGRTPYNLEVFFQKGAIGDDKLKQERHYVSSIVAHRNYTANFDYDAALVKLKVPVNLNETAPVCLPTSKEELQLDYASIYATVTGWGYTMEDGELSASLKKASVQVLSHNECQVKYAKITQRMLCASAPGTDACQGDSGGPLFYESNTSLRKYTQIGIVSWGVGCARPDRPGVYTRVTELIKWIRKAALDGQYCTEDDHEKLTM